MKMRAVLVFVLAAVALGILPPIALSDPVIEVDQMGIDFGDVAVRDTASQTLTVANTGDEVLMVESFSVDNEAFWVDYGELPDELQNYRWVRTENNHSILIVESIWDGEPLALGVEVGIFTPEGICGGGTQVIEVGEQIGLAAWQDDPETDEVEGFDNGEGFEFRFWDPVTNAEVEAEAEILFGPEVFTPDGLTRVILEAEGESHRSGESSLHISPDDQIDVFVYFNPWEIGEYESLLTIITNDPDNEEVVVDLAGRGIGENVPPEIHDPSEDELYEVIMHEGEVLLVSFRADDRDNEPEELEWRIEDAHDLPGEPGDRYEFGDDGNGTAGFIWSILYGEARDIPYRPVFRVSDPEGAYDEITLIISVWSSPWEPPDPIPPRELLEDCERTILFDLDDVFENFAEGELIYSMVFAPQSLRMEIDRDNRISVYPVPDFWVGAPGIQVTIEAQNRVGVTMVVTFRVIIHPLNDPPGEFNLLTPEDHYRPEPDVESIVFSWEQARQNMYEIDDVRYSMIFKVVVRMDSLIVPMLEDTSYDVDVNLLLDTLQVEEDVIRLIWYVVATDDSSEVVAANSAFLIDYLSVPGYRNDAVPDGFVLYPAYPNPFNSMATVGFSIPAPGIVKVSLFSLQGRKILYYKHNSWYIAGEHRLPIDLKAVPAGGYLLAVEYNGLRLVQRVILVK